MADPDVVLGSISTPNSKVRVPIRTSKPLLRLGRNSASDIKTLDQRCSVDHCQIHITRQPDKWLIEVEDLSSNGTFIDDVKLGKGNRAELQNGMVIGLLPASKATATRVTQFKVQIMSITAGIKR